jgi:hypothetical protein
MISHIKNTGLLTHASIFSIAVEISSTEIRLILFLPFIVLRLFLGTNYASPHPLNNLL